MRCDGCPKAVKPTESIETKLSKRARLLLLSSMFHPDYRADKGEIKRSTVYSGALICRVAQGHTFGPRSAPRQIKGSSQFHRLNVAELVYMASCRVFAPLNSRGVLVFYSSRCTSVGGIVTAITIKPNSTPQMQSCSLKEDQSLIVS